MSGILCEECQGYFQSSEHPCGTKLQLEVEKLQLELMARDTKPDFERGEYAGQDAMMRHIEKLTDDNNSALAAAVRKCELYQVKVRVLAQVADKLECASYSFGETFDPEAAKAFYSEFCILQKRCEIFAKDEVKLEG